MCQLGMKMYSILIYQSLQTSQQSDISKIRNKWDIHAYLTPRD